MSEQNHIGPHKLAEMILKSEPAKAAIAGSAGLLVTAAPAIGPAVAVLAVTLAATCGLAWGIGQVAKLLK